MKYPSLIAVSLFVCSSAAFAQDDQDIADKACDCVGDAYAKVEELKPDMMKAAQTQDMSKMMMIQGEMMQHMGAVNACFGKLAEQHPDIANNPERRGAVDAIMERDCPPPQFEMPGMTQ